MRLACCLAAGLVLTTAAVAQSPTLTVTVQQDNLPRIRSSGLLADGKFVGLMRSGFPLRLHYRLELWRERSSWFDQFIRETSWDAVARNDPLADDFVLIRQGGSIRHYSTAEELAAALEIPYIVTMRPAGSAGDRFYFVARLEVTTLNDTDLEELSRWLSGDVGPTVQGGENFGDALARGAQRALVRLAGLPRQRLEARSPTIRIADR